MPNSTGLYGPFSIDVFSKEVPKMFSKLFDQKSFQTRPVYMAISRLTCCPKKYLNVLSFSKLVAPEMIPNLTSVYGPSTRCPKRHLCLFKISRPGNDPKPDWFTWAKIIHGSF